jgi:hypothetical protein
MTVTVRTIGAPTWVENAFDDYLTPFLIRNTIDTAAEWRIIHDNGLAPVTDLANSDAVWISPEALIALNAWAAERRKSLLHLATPPNDWLSRLDARLTGRTVFSVPAGEIRVWTTLPKALGQRPWSQLSQGRVPEFRAARRNLPQLQQALANAPDDSSITLSGHIPAIHEEWCIIIDNGSAVAASGYCVHKSVGQLGTSDHLDATETPEMFAGHNRTESFDIQETHDIITVFDGAHFHKAYREQAIAAATAAAQSSGLLQASVIVAFAANRPYIIEADPLWCTAPYPFESDRETKAFLTAIANCRFNENDRNGANTQGKVLPTNEFYQPDPWMQLHNRRRYAGFS